MADEIHSRREQRYVVVGRSNVHRIPVVCHTDRGHTVRIISARQTTRGDVGRPVEAHGDILDVEFLFGSADSVIVELAPCDLRLPGTSEVLHVRETRAD